MSAESQHVEPVHPPVEGQRILQVRLSTDPMNGYAHERFISAAV